jgi:hypothetical protein
MTTLDLEKLAFDATDKVASLVANASVGDDGGGAYLHIPLSVDVEDYLIVSVPVLFNGEDAEWGANTGDHNHSWESDFTVHTDAEAVAKWINTTVLVEAVGRSK